MLSQALSFLSFWMAHINSRPAASFTIVQSTSCDMMTKRANYRPLAALVLPVDVTISASDYTDSLRFRAAKQSASPITVMAQSSNLVAFVSQSSTLGSWILDSSASDHMTGNQSLFSQLSFSDSLPSVTLTNGSKTKVCGIGQTRSLPNLSLNSVLFVPGCPFNLISFLCPFC